MSPSASTTLAAWIPLVALGTRGCAQRLCMAGAAGTATMVDSTTSLVCNPRMWTFINRRPVIRRVAARAIQAKHACVESRILVATRTGSRQASKLPRGMTLFASHGGVCAGQREFAFVVVKIDMVPAGGVVTGRTVFAELTIVSIISLMA